MTCQYYTETAHKCFHTHKNKLDAIAHTCFSLSSLPCMHFVDLVFKSMFMLNEYFCICLSLIPNNWWIHLIENWDHNPSISLLAIKYLCEFIQTPCGRCIVLGENEIINHRFFYWIYVAFMLNWVHVIKMHVINCFVTPLSCIHSYQYYKFVNI